MTDKPSSNGRQRQENGTFAAGNRCGRGRPTGSRNRAAVALDELAQAEAESVLRATVEAAKSGDIRAAELVLSRIWPVRKGRPVNLRLPVIDTAGDVSAALGALVEAVAAGEVTPEEAGSIGALLEGKRRAIETADLEARIAALEANHEGH